MCVCVCVSVSVSVCVLLFVMGVVLLPTEPGGGRVCCLSVHVHEITGSSSPQDCHSDYLQRSETLDKRCPS